jgi:putative transposase
MRIRNSRATYLHQATARLVRENDIIAIEKLNIKGLASGMLAKSVNDAAWAKFKEFLTYKAASAGRQIIEVDPRNTTQACPGCGVIVPKGLGDRWHECPDCGLSLDRDENAVRNILARSGAIGAQDKAVAYICA